MRLTLPRTFRDKTDDEEIMATLIEIVEELGKDLDRLQFAGKTVTVKYKVCYPVPLVERKKTYLISPSIVIQLHTYESKSKPID